MQTLTEEAKTNVEVIWSDIYGPTSILKPMETILLRLIGGSRKRVSLEMGIFGIVTLKIHNIDPDHLQIFRDAMTSCFETHYDLAEEQFHETLYDTKGEVIHNITEYIELVESY